jgi:hypothetical protein
MLPSACSFIVDGLTFSCRMFYTTCFCLHGHLQVCMMFHFYIPEGICFAEQSTNPTDNNERQESKQAHKNKETNENSTENTNGNVHSVTTCKKRQQKQRSRFFQEYKSETSYTLEDGHVGRNMLCRTATTKRKTIYNKAARRRQHNLKTYSNLKMNHYSISTATSLHSNISGAGTLLNSSAFRCHEFSLR